MTLTVSAELQELLDSQLATGRYSDTEELLRHALAALAEYEGTIEDLKASQSDLAAGRTQSVEEFAEKVRQQHGWSIP